MEMPMEKLHVQCLHLRTYQPVQTHTVLHVQVVAAFMKNKGGGCIPTGRSAHHNKPTSTRRTAASPSGHLHASHTGKRTKGTCQLITPAQALTTESKTRCG